ncbi:hypothetical protein EVAR_53506_1 [Eumeta japonica]|uniref:Uncharacterized protein n=1 Tax=Eumeta variegata TaxID=151549 RepID=A0A4C1Y7P6_EUMVA|nr:hypothetical protein EVAR_53506_1 [Eumeta japonica]
MRSEYSDNLIQEYALIHSHSTMSIVSSQAICWVEGGGGSSPSDCFVSCCVLPIWKLDMTNCESHHLNRADPLLYDDKTAPINDSRIQRGQTYKYSFLYIKICRAGGVRYASARMCTETERILSRGRPKKKFAESSERSKHRKTEELRLQDVEKLSYATLMVLRASCKSGTSKVVKDLTKSPRRARKYRSAFRKSNKEERQQLSSLEALSITTLALSNSIFCALKLTHSVIRSSYAAGSGNQCPASPPRSRRNTIIDSKRGLQQLPN